ncbi:AAA-like domain-containing protein [Microcystis wesenbergii FACHB-1317]|uniref:AAA-like domain-containing protein n=1 Tax=Microcystis TaxID=1125 RepID=UPI000E3696A1|nr:MULTISPECIES: AAA-like domain-containing protein [Microcystis]MBD2290790.1 AAA-like domain-containing protein [Microcystis wesenbergii FACHB-1317]REJ55422.1 MAG: TIR domain-containing protein [Microcystis aeruginosa TA09]UZO77805.1 AAA-like domain-containing protein [Microcystis aeruginosa str. Chao 1910]
MILPNPDISSTPLDVFISYSHRDEKLRETLGLHLASLQRQGVIKSWHDRKISAGTEWKQAIDENLNSAEIILLLISENFIASDYCYDLEMERAIARHDAGEARVIPIILKPVDWSGAPFGKLQALPKNAKPVTTWSNRGEAFLNIAKGIRHAAMEMATVLTDKQPTVLPEPQQSAKATEMPTQSEPLKPTVTPDKIQQEISLESPEGQVSIDSRFYITSPYEERCYEEIQKPGSLIRIKSPHNMGKSSLMAKVLAQASQLGYRAVTIDLEQTNQKFFDDLDKFMQWFCASVGKPLGVRVKIEEYWDDIFGANDNSTDYFEKYLLEGDDRPLVLAIDNFDRIFKYADIETDLCGLLRGWHESSKIKKLWQKLRLIIVHSQESYAQRDINQSPFNVGLPIELGEFTPEQVQELVARHGLTWTEGELEQFMGLIGGHPYMVRSALYHIAAGDLSLAEFLRTAPTEAGIYSDYLRGHLKTLEDYPELGAAMKLVITSEVPVRLRSEESFKLDSMGLVVRVDNNVKPRCDLYRRYFCDRLGGN